MISVVLNKTYTAPPISEKDILRYAKTSAADGGTAALMNASVKEAESMLTYKVCYCELLVTVTADTCDFGAFCLRSNDLSRNLKNCKRVVIFAATVGVGIDRLISKYSVVSPSKALMLDAVGTERIEALCDTFVRDIADEMNVHTKPRFSPGYGDLPLDAQRSIFAVLDCGRRIGLSCSDSLIMSPSKSVTAFVGLCGGNTN